MNKPLGVALGQRRSVPQCAWGGARYAVCRP
ncbi:hypothetical protein I656_03459 [Geobacillus sp. WSUCF1]|nr:hypothetical protein I656_03459 [Geobacillus sp. WSUCF1]